MTQTFTKLFASITESTIWCEPDRTRIVWICMLAMADRKGRVHASIPGLANRARVPLEDAKAAITAFLSPDPYSRTSEHEGRRIEPIDGGWRLLNYDKYRDMRDDESVLEAKRRYINNRRAAERAAKNGTTVESVEECRSPYTQAEAEAEAEAEEKKKEKTPRKRAAPAAPLPCPPDVDAQVWADWLALRRAKKAPVTATVLKGAQVEAQKAGMSLEGFLSVWCRRGSQGLEAGWLKPEERVGAQHQRTPGRTPAQHDVMVANLKARLADIKD